ncbi:hypothetical protein Droror1_Dr00016285, partial [Drosera rotundifolia]
MPRPTTFRLETFWLEEREFKALVSRAWSRSTRGSRQYVFIDRLLEIRDTLKLWNRRDEADLFKVGVQSENLLQILYEKEEMGLLTEAEEVELRCAENCQTASLLQQENFVSRHFRSKVSELVLDDGWVVSVQWEMVEAIVEHYKGLWTKTGDADDLALPELPTLTAITQEELIVEVTDEEILAAMKSMGKDKCAGPDGLPIEFFLKFWDIL